MRLTTINKSIFIAMFIVLSSSAFATQIKKQMPPIFSFRNEPEKVLCEYPLGLINKREAFAHHGGPVRKLILPNGNHSWLYSTGEEAGIPEIYIAVF